MKLQVIYMKSMKVSHDSKEAIKNYSDGTYDKSVNELIDHVGDYLPLINWEDNSKTVINLNEDTIERIKSYRLSYGESVENILIRMLITSQVLNNSFK